MSEKELLEHFKIQRMKAQYYLQRYIDELKLHFGIEDIHIIKILENEIKILKNKDKQSIWFNIFKKF